MAAMQRLAQLVIARRVQLGYKTRASFTKAAHLSPRTLGDIETGRRPSYDKATMAALEQVLHWTTGSIDAILDGGEPQLLDQTSFDAEPDRRDETDEALRRVMLSDLPDETKKALVKLLNAEREAFDRQRAERADELIRMLSGRTRRD